ncbi:MAG: cellulase family glycosylhydrolase [Trueperaceae bacterium]
MRKAYLYGLTTWLLLVALLVACSGEKIESLAASQDHIKNGQFEEGEKHWVFYTSTNTSVKYSKKIENGRFCLTVDNGGDVAWDIGFYQQGFELEAGINYDLTFTVSTAVDATADFYVKVTEGQEPYMEYSYTAERVSGDSGETKTISFMMPSREVNARVAFQLGGKSERQVYCFDDISLTYNGGESEPTEPTEPEEEPTEPTEPTTPIDWQLGPGLNMGGTLESPIEGEWHDGFKVQEEHIRLAKEAGFKSLRLPIRWSTHTIDDNHTIDPTFFARVDEIISWAHKHELVVVLAMLNWGHYGEDYNSLYFNPPAHRAKFMKLWEQISEHYNDYSNDSLYFELLNEPHNGSDSSGKKCTDILPENQCFTIDNVYWGDFLQEGLKTIRGTGGNNATRQVIIGNAEYNNAFRGGLNDTFAQALPANDRNIIVPIHMYQPINFTHYGRSPDYTTKVWNGTESEKADILTALNNAEAWAKKHNRPIFIGEWGVIDDVEPASRLRYIEYVVSELKSRNITWQYWTFDDGEWAVFDKENNRFYPELIDALLKDDF